ncbi:MAG: ferrous iron transport protein B [Acidobacteriota bacterium]|nr:ferrous iron transport protein B [Acidobacteriota bacterium]
MSGTALARGPASRQALVLVAGNPNSGKSTLFNALSGARTRVANYPGVTIDRRSATVALADGRSIELTDLPGTYSLSARSREEQIAVESLLGRGPRRPDAILVVADATALARALYLTLEILEIGRPVVIALNMADEAERDGILIDIERLEQLTGARVVRTVASRGVGLEALRTALASAIEQTAAPPPAVERTPEMAADLAELEGLILSEGLMDRPEDARVWAQWLLLSLDHDDEDEFTGIPASLRRAVRHVHERATQAGRNLDLEIISARYRVVDELMAAVCRAPEDRPRSWTDRVDAVLTHKVGGMFAFAAVMMVVFQALFSWSEPAIAAIEEAVSAVQQAVTGLMPPGPLTSLLVDGVIAGVGNVIVFVPQIGLLFLFIGILEDLGYLARAAFVIDRVMRAVGLHGRAFVPMLSGFSCAVPAVMATRTLDNRTDRLLTMLVLPLTSCSARLPVYVLVTATVFAPGSRVGLLSAGAVALFAMYALSVVAALAAAAVLRRTVLKGPVPTLMLELPPYRRPVLSVLLRGVWQRVRTFLVDAGTVILALTIVLWALLSYPKSAEVAAQADRDRAAVATLSLPDDARGERLASIDSHEGGEQLRYSVAGRIGRLMEPVIAPLGFDWRIGVGILGAFAAREVFVGTLGIVFDISNADETNEPLRETLRAATWPDGSPLMTPLAGVSLMVFFVLACQCMSTVAVVRRESGTWRWPLFMVAYMTVLAYMGSLAVYQAGRALGWGI